ncbi:hypothetical protein [Tessaracoccus antarcticus]|uniref:Uncharacterized protein n=1 Tax=Tessaracoccus antarcticus TaxID=2479848 RepID=A0A3M0G1Q9_9ACTN|nr:hypothetical protein [Tessaracoccus antarcticus]RMB58920.1 hypothetical protein EAX62_12480 [Tessaracoccus antarcticus]
MKMLREDTVIALRDRSASFLGRLRAINDRYMELSTDIRAYPATRSAAMVVLPARTAANDAASRVLDFPTDQDRAQAA